MYDDNDANAKRKFQTQKMVKVRNQTVLKYHK